MKHGSSVSNEVTTRIDSRHFDSSAERHLFKDIAGVSGNRCIKHGSSSTLVDWQTTVGVFFQDPDISKNIFRFPASPAINDTLGAYRPTSGTGSVNSAEIQLGVPEIFACERKRVRSAVNGVVVGEVRKTTTVSLLRLMNSACASQIRPRSDSLSLRNARTDGHTDRQTDRQTDTSPLYIDIYIHKYIFSTRAPKARVRYCNNKVLPTVRYNLTLSEVTLCHYVLHTCCIIAVLTELTLRRERRYYVSSLPKEAYVCGHPAVEL